MSPTLNPSVLIAGAGPTGLVLALWLKKKGISFRIIDKSSKPGETSRALAVQARTLEFYRQLGIAESIIHEGILVREAVFRRKGKVVARAPLGAIGEDFSPFPYLLFLSQDVHEQFLCEELERLGVQIERQTELLSFTQDEHGVQAVLNGPRGEESMKADYLCGCDGAHSLVRHGMASDFPGGTYEQVFFVADVQATGEMAEGGVQLSVSADDFCIVMPIKKQGSVRLTGLVPPAGEGKATITYEDVKESVARNTGLKVEKVNWFSSYHVHHRVASHFRQGRVFLSGDAGHIHSPAGGQGMNTGIGDAINLAWKLAEVIQGHASEKLLDSYEPERMAFAKVLVASTDTAFSFLASRSWIGSFWRVYMIPKVFTFMAHFKPATKIAFKTISQIRIKYRQSPLSQSSDGDVQAGDRLPWVPMGNGDNFEPLKSLDWQVHVYGEVTLRLKQFCSRGGISLQQFPWTERANKAGLLQNALYLIRPDGHIGYVSESQNVMGLEQYVTAYCRHLRPEPAAPSIVSLN